MATEQTVHSSQLSSWTRDAKKSSREACQEYFIETQGTDSLRYSEQAATLSEAVTHQQVTNTGAQQENNTKINEKIIIGQ